MKFRFRPPSGRWKINHREFRHGKKIVDPVRLLYHILGVKLKERKQSLYPKALVQQVELMMRHLLLRGTLNPQFVRAHMPPGGILTMAGVASNAASRNSRVRYSDAAISFMLMLLAQVTYLGEDVDAQDAVETEPHLHNLMLDRDTEGGIKSTPEFRDKHGFEVDVSNERPRWG